MADDAFDKGMALRHEMFGPRGAEEALEAATDFTRPLQEWVTKQCFGEAWQRPAFDARTRSLLTLAMLVATGRSHEVKIHTRGALCVDVEQDDGMPGPGHIARHGRTHVADADKPHRQPAHGSSPRSCSTSPADQKPSTAFGTPQ